MLLRRTVSIFPYYPMCARKTMRTDALTLADSSFLSGRKRGIYSTHTLLQTPMLTVRRCPRTVSRCQQAHTPLEIESGVIASLGRRFTFVTPCPRCSESVMSSEQRKGRDEQRSHDPSFSHNYIERREFFPALHRVWTKSSCK